MSQPASASEADRASGPAPMALSRRDLMAMAGAIASTAATGGAWAQAAAPKRGGVLKVSANANPSSLDPATGGAGSDHTFLWTLFDTLVEWDYQTLKTKPGLAKYSFPDPLTMVLDIQPGIVFHDGTPMNAEAVKFNFDRNRQDPRSNIKADLQNVAEVLVSGPLQVTVKLQRPDTALPAILSDRAGMMVSPKAVQALGAEHDRKPVGAGPWKIVRWSANEKVEVTRADNYWRKDRGFVDGIEFFIIPELATGLRAVVSGQNDFAYQVPPRLIPIITKAKQLRQISGPTLYCLQLYLNLAKPGLDKLKVRQALNHAVDRQAFVKGTLAGVGEPAYMNLPKSHWAFDESLVGMYPRDPAKARALLAEAGYKDGIELIVGSYTDQDSVRRSEIVMEQLREAGIRLKFITGTIPEISGQFFGTEKKFDMLLSAWTGRPDPSMTYSLMYSKDAYFNAGRVDTGKELADMLAESRVAERIESRTLIFRRLQRHVMENALVVPLAFQYELVAASSKVQGYASNLLGKPKYEFIALQ
jgi:ABC-type transport system substrate-binding protein